jgi:GAF domain-containing protein
VFDTMLQNATRICEAKHGTLFLFAEGAFQPVAAYGASAEPELTWDMLQGHAIQPTPGTGLGRMLRAKATVQIADVLADKDYPREHPLRRVAELRSVRTLLCVPMIKQDELIGAIAIYRREVRPFNDKQIALLENFTAQAVIAIENARLLNELRQRTTDLTEALEQQTATSEVLHVISGSPGELDPVFAAMLASATRICEAKLGNLFLHEAETFRAVAWHGDQTYVENLRREPLVIKTDIPDVPLARLAQTKRRVHIPDLTQDAAYKAGFAPLVALVDRGGARTLLIVPMLKERTLLGAHG